MERCEMLLKKAANPFNFLQACQIRLWEAAGIQYFEQTCTRSHTRLVSYMHLHFGFLNDLSLLVEIEKQWLVNDKIYLIIVIKCITTIAYITMSK